VGWGGLRTDFSDRLSGLEMPTLLIHGAHDRAVPIAWARRAQERIRDCELRVFSECGHLPPREQPEEFAGVVEDPTPLRLRGPKTSSALRPKIRLPFSPTLPCKPLTHLPSHQHAMPIGIRTWVYHVPATTMRRA
jgi:hypothetical protein